MATLAPGDIVEIQTGGGLAYVLVTHLHSSYPPVVKALPGLFNMRPVDLCALAAKQAAFTAMIPLSSALSRLGVTAEVVDHAEIPTADQAFPTFRMPIRDKRGEIVYWWLWDGESLRYDVELDAAQSDLPLREVLSAERFLKQLIETGARH
ncbi:MAG: hypothetical protein WD969_11255 [Paracoccaceae bacterium]